MGRAARRYPERERRCRSDAARLHRQHTLRGPRVRSQLSRWIALLLAALTASPAPTREDVDAPARNVELRTCLIHIAWIAPLDPVIADRASFCGCCADEAVRDRLWELEKADANLDQGVHQLVADRTIRLHDRKLVALAASSLRR